MSAPEHITSTAPERIYLDLPEDVDLWASEITDSKKFAAKFFEATWSEDCATGVGIPYVRADLVPTPAAGGAAPLTDDDLDDLSHSAIDEFMGSGLDRHTLLRYFKTIRNRAALASPQVATAPEPVAWRYKPSKVLAGTVLTDDLQMIKLASEHGCDIEPLCHCAAAPVQVAPKGKMKATQAMIQAGAAVIDRETRGQFKEVSDGTTTDTARMVWHEMLAATPMQAPAASDDARDAADTLRMNWLETMAVNVRVPLRCGSRDLFWSSPDDGDGFVRPSDIRSKIDAAMRRSGPAAKPAEPTLGGAA